MSLFDLVLIAVSLSMDAFAVSICKGLSVHKVQFRHALICGIWFGGFQAGMPALGYFLGDRFSALLTRFGPWIAFLLPWSERGPKPCNSSGSTTPFGRATRSSMR